MRKTKNRNKTKMMVLIVIVVLYVIFLIVGLILDMKSRKKDQDNAIARYLVIDHFANLKYSNKAWHKVSQAEIERYSGLYHVFGTCLIKMILILILMVVYLLILIILMCR